MRKIAENEIQSILLNMLKAFKVYCEEKNVEFLLCGGTLLGAVRHKGFIPWDDDIDLYITPESFEKLTEIAGQNPYIDAERRYKILVPAKAPNVYPFFKVIDTYTVVYEKNQDKNHNIGFWLDLFCVSYWPDDIAETKKSIKRFNFYKQMNKLLISGNLRDLKYKVVYPFAFPAKIILKMLNKDSEYWCQKMLALDCHTSGKYRGDVAWPGGTNDYYESAWFDGVTELSFEDDVYKAPIGYKEILTRFYGDYMMLPPLEKRVRHEPEAYYLNENEGDIR